MSGDFSANKVLTKDDALKISLHAVNVNFEDAPAYTQNQPKSLASEMAARCAFETLRNKEGLKELEERLYWAIEFVQTLQSIGMSTRLQNLLWRGEGIDESEKKLVERARWVVWEHKDARQSYIEGTESVHYFPGDTAEIRFAATQYLERPWARHATIDWILLDMLLTREACVFGEEIKMTVLPGPREDFGLHAFYFKHNGNLRKMQSDWTGYAERFFQRVFWLIAAPMTAIYIAFRFDFQTTGIVFALIYGGLVAIWLIFKMIGFAARFTRAVFGIEEPANKPIELLHLMRDTIAMLEGPVVNPTTVRELMIKARDAGVVWDASSWAIIGRVIEIDPAVWVTRPTKA